VSQFEFQISAAVFFPVMFQGAPSRLASAEVGSYSPMSHIKVWV
jgi:hypothetical protein